MIPSLQEACPLKYKIISNKRGVGIDELIPLLIFVFLAGVIIIYVSIIGSGSEEKINEISEENKKIADAQEHLLNFLHLYEDNEPVAQHIIDFYYDDTKDYDTLYSLFKKLLSCVL